MYRNQALKDAISGMDIAAIKEAIAVNPNWAIEHEWQVREVFSTNSQETMDACSYWFECKDDWVSQNIKEYRKKSQDVGRSKIKKIKERHAFEVLKFLVDSGAPIAIRSKKNPWIEAIGNKNLRALNIFLKKDKSLVNFYHEYYKLQKNKEYNFCPLRAWSSSLKKQLALMIHDTQDVDWYSPDGYFNNYVSSYPPMTFLIENDAFNRAMPLLKRNPQFLLNHPDIIKWMSLIIKNRGASGVKIFSEVVQQFNQKDASEILKNAWSVGPPFKIYLAMDPATVWSDALINMSVWMMATKDLESEGYKGEYHNFLDFLMTKVSDNFIRACGKHRPLGR